MKIDSQYKLQTIGNEHLVIVNGSQTGHLSHVVSLNPTATFLWQALEGKDFTALDVARMLSERFDVDEKRASEDAQKWIDQLKQYNIV